MMPLLAPLKAKVMEPTELAALVPFQMAVRGSPPVTWYKAPEQPAPETGQFGTTYHTGLPVAS